MDTTKPIDLNDSAAVLELAKAFNTHPAKDMAFSLSGNNLFRFAQYIATHAGGYKPDYDVGRRAGDISTRLRINEMELMIQRLSTEKADLLQQLESLRQPTTA